MNEVVKLEIADKEGVLQALAEEISISPSLDKKARDRYKAIGSWLDRPESRLKPFAPEISSQGSFMLGTVIRPLGDADAYDVDVVCNLEKGDRQTFSQAELKEIVGFELRAYAVATNMKSLPEDKRRCWTMEFADDASFHMDILPAIPSAQDFHTKHQQVEGLGNFDVDFFAKTSIAITDKKRVDFHEKNADWLISNPKGYRAWFRRRQTAVLRKHIGSPTEQGGYTASVEDVPSHQHRTPLQDTIKLLKRHRDSMFKDDEDKPISIIITTLATHAYEGQTTLVDSLNTILPNMYRFIEYKEGIPWVANPAYPLENFADKWTENPKKAENFSKWLVQVNRDFGSYMNASAYDAIPAELQDRLTETTVSKVQKRLKTLPSLSTAAIIQSEADKVASEQKVTKPWLP